MPKLATLSLIAALFGAAPATAATLDDLRWQYRVIVVFAPADGDGTDARETLAGAAGIDARHIAWFVVTPSDVHSNIDRRIGREALTALRHADGFESVLIGKDGGVKARQTQALDLRALFDKIDAMPMRRNEMKDAP